MFKPAHATTIALVNLTHHFLIAMPSMADPNFAKSLTYICEHNEQGALGVVVNRPIEMNLHALLEQFSRMSGPAGTPHEGKSPEMDAATRERLRALGYLQ